MLINLFPFLYGLSALVLLFLAAKVMLRGFISDQAKQTKKSFFSQLKGDRTGRVTIHPELLNKEGQITDEELLTVRFSTDITDPPQSAEKPSQ